MSIDVEVTYSETWIRHGTAKLDEDSVRDFIGRKLTTAPGAYDPFDGELTSSHLFAYVNDLRDSGDYDYCNWLHRVPPDHCGVLGDEFDDWDVETVVILDSSGNPVGPPADYLDASAAERGYTRPIETLPEVP